MPISAEENTKYLTFANRLADEARAAILPFFRQENGVVNKGTGLLDFDPVTKADRAAELAIRGLIREFYPNDTIIGEEYGDTIGTSGIEWVIDPIDGTRAFMAGTTSWGVLIGGYYKGLPVFGILDQPFTGERWSGDNVAKIAKFSRGGETFAISCNPYARLENCVLATTDPFLFNEKEADAFASIRSKVPVVRYGLDCTAYSLLAHGTIGLVVETALKFVDIGALVPIIEAAGGIVTDWAGNHNPKSGQVVAAANRWIHQEALELLSA